MTLEQAIGAAVMLVFLADVFLTVLYARAGTGLLAPAFDRAIWAVLHAAAGLAGRRRGAVLSLAGPIIVVSLVAFWSLGLTVGAALLIRPELGTAIRPSSGDTPNDFVTALVVAGNSLSIVGGGDYSPHTSGTRLLFLMNSLIGGSVLSLILSFLVQVYAALRERNALALSIDLMTNGTGDAAEMLVRLMPGGDGGDAVSTLGNLVQPLAATKEAHHFYPLLFYFRFEEPLYAVSRFSVVLLDLTTLIACALDRQRYGALVDSTAVTALHHGALRLLETLDRHGPPAHGRPAVQSQGERQASRRAFDLLARHGIAMAPDAAERYGAARRGWDGLAVRVAPMLGYDPAEVDCRRPEARSDRRA